jgi:hypothetical protein
VWASISALLPRASVEAQQRAIAHEIAQNRRLAQKIVQMTERESVSQSPLKDKAFSTFQDQNPPFELPPKAGVSSRNPSWLYQVSVDYIEGANGNVAVRTRLPRWRRSADRARLQGDSLLRGNLSGKYQIFGLWGRVSEQNTAVVRRLIDQFPMKFNKENISWIREMFDRNSEFTVRIENARE